MVTKNKVDKYAFVNSIIGEGSTELWVKILGQKDYDTLMNRNDEKISDEISSRVLKMSTSEMNELSKIDDFNIEVVEN